MSLEEFKADNKQEIKMASAHLRPAISKAIDRVIQMGPSMPNWDARLASLPKSVIKTGFLSMVDPHIDEFTARLLYNTIMGGDDPSVSMEATLDKIKKLGAGGPELDKFMDEIEIASTSDSYTGEPIDDTDAMKIAGKVFLEKVLGL